MYMKFDFTSFMKQFVTNKKNKHVGENDNITKNRFALSSICIPPRKTLKNASFSIKFSPKHIYA